MRHFSEQVHITIGSFTQNIVYYDLKLSQKMADHHHFSFVWQYTGKAVIDPAEQAKALRKYLGDEVIFTFKSVTGIKLMSKGIITELASIDVHGSPVGLHVTGISHTVVLDDMKKSRNFLETGMDNIALKIFAEGPGEFYQRDAIRSTYLKEFNCITQYNETSFEFLKRLAARYGQWFYFDGMRMQYGQTKTSKVKLINGASLHSFKIQTNMTSHKISLGGYDYNNTEGIRKSALKTTTGSKDSFASIIGYNQGCVVQPDLNTGAHTSNAQNKAEMEEMVKLQTAGSDANSVFYSGISYFPLGLGQVFTITNKTVEHELIVIEATHHSQVHGNYSCEFKAIPADVGAPHYTDVHAFARAETQPAIVRDNNDPEGMGRVKVEFYWAGGKTSSEWMRMIQPHSGAGKGFYMIPEIGEEVLVGFEGGNVQNPYVMGAQYNGENKSGFATENNDLKVWQTRSGNKIVSDDATGDITIESGKGEAIAVIHGDGNIRFKATKNIEFEAGEDIIMNAGKNARIEAKENIEIEAGKDIAQTASNDVSITAGGDILESGDTKTEIVENDYTRGAGETADIFSKKVSVNSSEEDISLNSSKSINLNSGENSLNH